MTPKQANQKRKCPRSQLLAGILAGLASGLLREQVLVNIGQDTTLRNGDVTQKLVQLLVVADGELEMPGNDTGLLVVARSVASQLKNFGREILEDGSEVDGSARTDALRVVALSEQTVDTTDREGQTSLGGSSLRVLGTAGLAAGFATSSHFDGFVDVWGMQVR